MAQVTHVTKISSRNITATRKCLKHDMAEKLASQQFYNIEMTA